MHMCYNNGFTQNIVVMTDSVMVEFVPHHVVIKRQLDITVLKILVIAVMISFSKEKTKYINGQTRTHICMYKTEVFLWISFVHSC